ncbi:MAG: S-adenosylmethionine:tRNA ribosyltransferase-isomerase, partial [Muribaculaceae bacterium]|nr:S-adenosylmethionine:tRNA ribosyltransferase-isomerase [Muribaculaceae bacterium]
VHLLRELNAENKFWDVLVEPARKIRIGNKLYFGDDDMLVAEVIDNTTSRGRTLRFLYDGTHEEFKKALFSLGKTLLPPYFSRESEDCDADDYQTVFARHEGAVVAPSAGLHFSRELMKHMEIKGVERGYITLHSGLGAYRDIDVEDLTKHRMDSEEVEVGPKLVEMVNKAKDEGRQVCAVGASVLRGISDAVSMDGHLKSISGWTNKFIFPPYDFTVTTSFVTNFHLPYSTMLMLTAAFGGYNHVMNAYDVAVKEGYRFGAYGDAMLII